MADLISLLHSIRMLNITLKLIKKYFQIHYYLYTGLNDTCAKPEECVNVRNATCDSTKCKCAVSFKVNGAACVKRGERTINVLLSK